MHIAILVRNTFRPHPTAPKEAQSLVESGNGLPVIASVAQ